MFYIIKQIMIVWSDYEAFNTLGRVYFVGGLEA